MDMDLQNFTPAERATFTLRALYEQAGYRKYRCSRFEEYALYQEYNRFLPDTQVVTFTDLDGKLRAIKPDVTLSIAKTAQPAPAKADEAPNVNPVELGAVEVPKTEDGKLDATKIADPADFGDWEEQGCKG